MKTTDFMLKANWTLPVILDPDFGVYYIEGRHIFSEKGQS